MKKLERSLGLPSVISISLSSMLGGGIFVLPALAISQTGPSAYLAYVLASICVLPAALSKSELATAMPVSGGTYVYIERTFGPLAGTVAGLGLWLSLLLKCAFALVGFGAYLSVLTDIPIKSTSLILLCVITFLNILGIGKVSWILTTVVVASVIWILTTIGFSYSTEQILHTGEFLTSGFGGLFATIGLVFVSYAGVTKIAAIAEEVKDPSVNIPRGMLISLVIITVLYGIVNHTLANYVPTEELKSSLNPLFHWAKHVGGDFLALPMAVIAVVTMTSMANAGVLAASRFPFAMSRDKLLPQFLKKINRRFLTPVPAIILSAGIVGFCVAFLEVSKIAKLASAFMIIMFMAVNFTVILLREARVQWYKPSYKSPLYPFVQVFGVVSGAVLLYQMGALLTLGGIMAIGIPGGLLYFFYSKKKADRRGVIGIRGKRSDLIGGDDGNAEIFENRNDMEDFFWEGEAKVVVSLFGKERSPEMLIEMGAALADGEQLEVTHLTEAPEQTDLSGLSEEPTSLKSLRRRVVAMAVQQNLPITFDPVVSHDIVKTVYEISQRCHCDWMLIEWTGKSRGTFTNHDPMGWLRDHLDCNLAIFRDAGVRYIRKILVIVNEDDNDDLVVDTADHLAKIHHAEITLAEYVHTTTGDDTRGKAMDKLVELSNSCESRSRQTLIIGEKRLNSIIEKTAEYDLVVFGAARHSFLGRIVGTQDDRLMAQAACSVIAVLKGTV